MQIFRDLQAPFTDIKVPFLEGHNQISRLQRKTAIKCVVY